MEQISYISVSDQMLELIIIHTRGNKMKRKLITVIVSTALLLNPMVAQADNDVTVDGKMVAGRVFVPIRETSDQLGSKISWNQKDKDSFY